MDIRCIGVGLSVLMILAAGCKKAEPVQNPAPASPTPSAPPVPLAETLARIHWLGKKQIALETDAVTVMKIWELPESATFEAQTLNKLSLAPWSLLHLNADTNTSARLRSLFADVFQEEFWVEVRSVTNQPGALILAICLDESRAGVWETNLAAALESLTGIRPAARSDGYRGWQLKKHHAPNLIELTRAGSWTVIGAGQDHNALVDDVLARIQQDGAPFAKRLTNYWLEADFDPGRIATALSPGWNLPKDMPGIVLSVIGDGRTVQTRGQLNFPQPLVLDLDAWNISTNLIEGTLNSMTVIRGIRPGLASLAAWNNLKIGPPADQLYVWAAEGAPMRTCFMAPLQNASNEVQKLTDHILQQGGPWFATNDLVQFERSKTSNGLTWRGLPFMSPFLSSVATDGSEYVTGGFLSMEVLQPQLPEWWREISLQTNLVYHDWENTGLRIEQWSYMAQFFRAVLQKAQLPVHSAGSLWLKAITPRLGVSVTQVIKTRPDQLLFTRNSDLGFTALELQLLTDWLESPQFPIGLHTLLAPPQP